MFARQAVTLKQVLTIASNLYARPQFENACGMDRGGGWTTAMLPFQLLVAVMKIVPPIYWVWVYLRKSECPLHLPFPTSTASFRRVTYRKTVRLHRLCPGVLACLVMTTVTVERLAVLHTEEIPSWNSTACGLELTIIVVNFYSFPGKCLESITCRFSCCVFSIVLCISDSSNTV